jgi:hypothetical protein
MENKMNDDDDHCSSTSEILHGLTCYIDRNSLKSLDAIEQCEKNCSE